MRTAMYTRRTLLVSGVCAATSSLAAIQPLVTNFRFGIIREVTEGDFEFVEETTRIPRKYKNSGFRWGIGFDNPSCASIEWYENIHLPTDLKTVSGNLQKTRTKVMRTQTHRSSQPTVVDDFWFDEGDPLGKHRIELFINGAPVYWLDFQVIA
jgi:hypothetical protein